MIENAALLEVLYQTVLNHFGMGASPCTDKNDFISRTSEIISAANRIKEYRAKLTAITFTFDLPHGDLNPNRARNVHHFKKSKLINERRLYSCMQAMATMRRAGFDHVYDEVLIYRIWYHKTMRFPDRDNIPTWLKSSMDGLVDSGISSDDKHFSFAPIEIKKDAQCPRVEITFIGE